MRKSAKFLTVIITSLGLVAMPAPLLAESVGDTVGNTINQVERSDTWLQARLVTTFTLNRHLDIFDINVDVRDQVAYLGGVVESDVEKDLATEVAKSIEGIRNIENSIKVVSGEAERARERATNRTSFGQTIEDMTVTAALKSKLFMNSNVKGLDVAVSTTDGKVLLKGIVDNDAQKALVEEIAKNTTGVQAVENDLKVKGSA